MQRIIHYTFIALLIYCVSSLSYAVMADERDTAVNSYVVMQLLSWRMKGILHYHTVVVMVDEMDTLMLWSCSG